MKRGTLFSLAIALVSATQAFAGLTPSSAFLGTGQYMPNPQRTYVEGVNIQLTAIPVDAADEAQPRAFGNDMFRAIAGPYAAFAADGGVLGYDDYQGIVPPGDADGYSPLDEFGFVGGVTAGEMTLQFQFYDSNADFHASFDITLANPGNFIYTFTTAGPGSPPFFDIPNSGYVQVVAADGSSGQWFLSATLPEVGTESRDPGEGSVTSHSHRFRLDVPEPATLALLGFGALAMIRRRR